VKRTRKLVYMNTNQEQEVIDALTAQHYKPDGDDIPEIVGTFNMITMEAGKYIDGLAARNLVTRHPRVENGREWVPTVYKWFRQSQ
jgi:hypothetical protein